MYSFEGAAIIVFIVFTVLLLMYLIGVNGVSKRNVDFKNDGNKSPVLKVRNINELPGPKPFPLRIIGNLFQLPKSFDTIMPKLVEWHKNFGSCYRLTVLGQDFVMIGNAPLAQSVLQSNAKCHMKKTDVYIVLEELGGLACSSGQRYEKMKKLISPAFHFKTENTRVAISNNQAEKLIDFLRRNNESKYSVGLLLARCTVNVIIDSFLSGPGNYSDEDSMNYVKNWKRYTEIATYRIVHPWLALDTLWRRHPLYKEMNDIVAKLHEFVDLLIKPHLEKSYDIDDEENCTFIPQLLKQNYPLEWIRREVLTMLFGYEAFFLGLYYTMHMLASHPEHQDKCLEELKNVEIGDNIAIEQVAKMKHLERCLFETLRLLPPAFIFGRKIEADLILENGILLPPGTNVMIVPLVMHKLPEYYPSPSVFDPNRFLPENSKDRHPYSFLPFSAGPRRCMGMKPGITTIKIIMAKVLKNFVISTNDKFEQVKFTVSLAMVPENGLDLRFTPRQASK